MSFTVLSIGLIIVEVALAAFVASRSWHYRPSRLFVLFSATIVIVLGCTILRDQSPSPEAAYPWLGLLQLGVAAYLLLLMLLLSSLFMPEWWEGRRPPVFWISLPYLLGFAVMALDIFGPLQLVIDGARFEQIYRFSYVAPGDAVMRGYSLAGQVVFFAILGVALTRPRYREQRPLIALLIAALAAAIVLAVFSGTFTGLVRFVVLAQTLPIVAALAYAIIGTQLFLPTRIALDMALQSLRDSVVVFDAQGKVVFINPEADRLGLRVGEPPSGELARVIDGLTEPAPGAAGVRLERPGAPDAGATRTLRLGGRTLELSTTLVQDGQGRRRGALLLGRDVTELAQRTAELEQEQTRLAAALRRVEEEQRERAQLADTVRALTLPLIPVLPGVIVIPLIGDFTAERIEEFISLLLRGVERERADTVLLDITGIALLDTAGAQGLITAVRAAALLGARCVLVGVRPEVAQSLVALGIALDQMRSVQTLEQAVLERLRPAAV